MKSAPVLESVLVFAVAAEVRASKFLRCGATPVPSQVFIILLLFSFSRAELLLIEVLDGMLLKIGAG